MKNSKKQNLAEVNEVKAVETKESPAVEVKAAEVNEVKAVEIDERFLQPPVDRLSDVEANFGKIKGKVDFRIKKALLVFDRFSQAFRTDLGAYPDTKQGRWVLACDICNEYPTISIAAENKIQRAFVECNFDQQVMNYLIINGVEIVSYPLTTDFLTLAESFDEDPDEDSGSRKNMRSINSFFEGDD